MAAAGGAAVVMTYLNPVLRYGVDAFARDLAAAGGLGVITPDLIPDEAGEWIAASDGPRPRPDLPRGAVVHRGAARLDRRAPPAASSTPRRRWASPAPATRVGDAAPLLVRRCRAHTDLPVGVGLGVRSGAQAAEVAAFADGVIVGSAFVTAAETGGAAGARALAAELAEGVRAAG